MLVSIAALVQSVWKLQCLSFGNSPGSYVYAWPYINNIEY